MLTNKYGLNLSIAVWLATDNYDHSYDPDEISATSLIKSPRQIALARRNSIPGTEDISNKIASTIGTSIHDSLEAAWKQNYIKAMRELCYTEDVIHKIKINPDPITVTPDDIPIYIEQRVKKKVGKYTISGKYDFIGNGQLEDYKSTGTYTYVKKTNDEKYMQQGSIYRWLNPEIITNDTMLIQYIFLDWKEFNVSQKGYPPSKILSYPIKLMSIEETDTFIKNKLDVISSLDTTIEAELPLCTPEDLWQSDSVYSYYRNPAKTKRATKNFNTFHEAHSHQLSLGGGGLIVEKPGRIKACSFCGVRDMCSQKDTYIANGSLIL